MQDLVLLVISFALLRLIPAPIRLRIRFPARKMASMGRCPRRAQRRSDDRNVDEEQEFDDGQDDDAAHGTDRRRKVRLSEDDVVYEQRSICRETQS